jgi:hypothetical protein
MRWVSLRFIATTLSLNSSVSSASEATSNMRTLHCSTRVAVAVAKVVSRSNTCKNKARFSLIFEPDSVGFSMAAAVQHTCPMSTAPLAERGRVTSTCEPFCGTKYTHPCPQRSWCRRCSTPGSTRCRTCSSVTKPKTGCNTRGRVYVLRVLVAQRPEASARSRHAQVLHFCSCSTSVRAGRTVV